MAERTDCKLMHLNGLNLSHACMLEGIATGLHEDDVCWPALIVSVAAHHASGLISVLAPIYLMHCDLI